MQIDLNKHLNFRTKKDFVIDNIIDSNEIIAKKEDSKLNSES